MRSGRTLTLILLLIPLTLTVLTGCAEQDSLEARYRDYLQRVTNLLELDLAPEIPLPAIVFPDKRQRLLTLPEFSQGLVEVWDFQRCGLMPLINQRNSNLGKVMQPSQRYLYENHFWLKLDACYSKLAQWQEEDPDFVARLSAAWDHKKQIQPLVFHQMLFAGDELPGQFSQVQKTFGPDDQPEYQSVAAALEILANLSDAPYATRTDNHALEQQLQNLNQQPILHSLLKSLQVSTAYLNRLSEGMEARLDQRPVCLKANPTPKAKALMNVLQKFYLQGIQPLTAEHSRMANQLLPPLNRLFVNVFDDQAIPGISGENPLTAYRNRWLQMETETGLWQRFQQAHQRHTRIWNRLLNQCGLLPKR